MKEDDHKRIVERNDTIAKRTGIRDTRGNAKDTAAGQVTSGTAGRVTGAMTESTDDAVDNDQENRLP